MDKEIKAWAIVDKEERFLASEASPRWGRFWIFETRKQARKEVNDRFYNSPYHSMDKIIKIKIIKE